MKKVGKMHCHVKKVIILRAINNLDPTPGAQVLRRNHTQKESDSITAAANSDKEKNRKKVT